MGNEKRKRNTDNTANNNAWHNQMLATALRTLLPSTHLFSW